MRQVLVFSLTLLHQVTRLIAATITLLTLFGLLTIAFGGAELSGYGVADVVEMWLLMTSALVIVAILARVAATWLRGTGPPDSILR